jgi:hypothetical protein
MDWQEVVNGFGSDIKSLDYFLTYSKSKKNDFFGTVSQLNERLNKKKSPLIVECGPQTLNTRFFIVLAILFR